MKNQIDDLRSWSSDLPLHGKLTYFGPQLKPVPSVFFGLAATAIDYETFARHQSNDVRYVNDTLGNTKYFRITKQEQTAILENLARVNVGEPPSDPRWALVMVQIGPAGPRAIEWFLDAALARKVVSAIMTALAPENESGKRILEQMLLL